MPIVRVSITDEPLTRQEKEEIARRMTATLVDVLGKSPQTTHVVFERVPADEWAVAGELVDARRARGASTASAGSPLGVALGHALGPSARDRSEDMRTPDASGARAALETFYHAFNQRSLAALERVWAPDASVILCNPVGGVLVGFEAIRALYHRIFNGPARVWVEYHDVTEYAAGGHAVFVGRERGEFEVAGQTIELAIRTTRYFQQTAEHGWRQVHHHGSIDDGTLLAAYQRAVRGSLR
jgi:4-oxalocrotonate tautomerase family enzyme